MLPLDKYNNYILLVFFIIFSPVLCDTKQYNIFDSNIHSIVAECVSKSGFLKLASDCLKFNKIVIISNDESNKNFEPDVLEYLDEQNRKRIQTIKIFITDYKKYNISFRKCLKVRELIVLAILYNIVSNIKDVYEIKKLQSFSIKYIEMGYETTNMLIESDRIKKFKYILNYIKTTGDLKPLFLESNSFRNKIKELYLDLKQIDNSNSNVSPFLENIDKYTKIKKITLLFYKLTSTILQLLSCKLPKLNKLKSVNIHVETNENIISPPFFKKIDKIITLSLFNDKIYTDISDFLKIQSIKKLKITGFIDTNIHQMQTEIANSEIQIVEFDCLIYFNSFFLNTQQFDNVKIFKFYMLEYRLIDFKKIFEYFKNLQKITISYFYFDIFEYNIYDAVHFEVKKTKSNELIYFCKKFYIKNKNNSVDENFISEIKKMRVVECELDYMDFTILCRLKYVYILYLNMMNINNSINDIPQNLYLYDCVKKIRVINLETKIEFLSHFLNKFRNLRSLLFQGYHNCFAEDMANVSNLKPPICIQEIEFNGLILDFNVLDLLRI